MTNYWLVKSEPDVYSIDHLKSDRFTQWSGVRNYQARNYLMKMAVGDEVLFYHSNAELLGIVGIAVVKKEAYPDATQFDANSEFYDEKSTKTHPRWFAPDLAFKAKFERCVSLEEMRTVKSLSKLPLLQRGSRLSVQPVTREQFNIIVKLGATDASRKLIRRGRVG